MRRQPTKDKGAGITFIRAHVTHQGDECLIWSLCCDRGYGRVHWLGKGYWAHRVMCQMAHGEPPTPKHYATHNCGNGHLGCVNPKHLEWKTPTANQADRRLHGRSGFGEKKQKVKLTPQQVAEIHALKGQKSQAAIAAIYGVSQRNVCDILRGKNWKQYFPGRGVHESSATQRG